MYTCPDTYTCISEYVYISIIYINVKSWQFKDLSPLSANTQVQYQWPGCFVFGSGSTSVFLIRLESLPRRFSDLVEISSSLDGMMCGCEQLFSSGIVCFSEITSTSIGNPAADQSQNLIKNITN